MPGDSFLQSVLKDRTRQSGVIDNAAKLGSGRTTSFTRPLANRGNTSMQDPMSLLDVEPTPTPNVPAMPSNPTAAANVAPVREMQSQAPQDRSAAAQTMRDMFPSEMGQFRVQNIADEIDANLALPQVEAAFYQKTGRRMSTSDRILMASRTEFFKRMGRVPTKSELIYEAQRGMLSAHDPMMDNLS